jgi:uncharacterized protein
MPELMPPVVDQFLEYACPDHHVRGRPAHAMARGAAVRLLNRHPELARANFYTAIVCGETELVERMLREEPDLARRKSAVEADDRSGPGSRGDLFRDISAKSWEPLLFVCFARLPVAKAEANAVAMARLLLDSGADPNSFFMAGMSRYTPLVGVIGEGEENRPAHAHRDELARLLLERGARPYDLQVVYNIHFHGQVLWFLKLIYEFSAKEDWADPEWKMLDMGRYGSGARWHLGLARKNEDRELEEWCLAHGAKALEEATAEERSTAAQAIFAAAKRDRADEVATLLDSGVPLEIEDAKRMRPLHFAAAHDAVHVAQLLLERGAEVDPVEENWNNTPLDFAVYHEFPRMVELLAPHSSDVGNLVFTGHVERLREVLTEAPESGPLFWLPDDEAKAVEIVDLFVSLGADVGARNGGGQTAADIARRRGMNEAAERLEKAGAR